MWVFFSFNTTGDKKLTQMWQDTDLHQLGSVPAEPGLTLRILITALQAVTVNSS